MSLKRKFKYERVPLVDDEEVRKMKQKFGHRRKPLQLEENTSKRAKASKVRASSLVCCVSMCACFTHKQCDPMVSPLTRNGIEWSPL